MDVFHLMPINTTSGHRMVRFKVSLAWNKLPKSLTDISSFDIFKKKFKLHLISYCKLPVYKICNCVYSVCTCAPAPDLGSGRPGAH
jgi:hypothetical protein